MNKPRLRFIANPFSGTNKAQQLEKYIDKYLNKDKYDYDISYTEYAGHAVSLAKEAVDLDYFAVIAAGGDGTLNEVATTCAYKNTALGIIPMGSGNGFSYHIGVRRDIAKAFRRINKGRTKSVDLCFANERPFINVSGMGLDAEVAALTKTNKRRGFIPYVTNTIWRGSQYKGLYLTVENENGDTYSGTYMMAAVANGSIYGYSFAIAPMAKIGDGLFDVVLVAKKSVFHYIGLAFRMLTLSVQKSNLVTYFKCKELTIRFDGEQPVHYDGEASLASDQIHFRIERRALLFIR